MLHPPSAGDRELALVNKESHHVAPAGTRHMLTAAAAVATAAVTVAIVVDRRHVAITAERAPVHGRPLA